MALTANLSTTVTLSWVNRRGCDRDCEVNVDYTFDGGDDLRIKASEIVGDCDLGEWAFDELLWEAVMDRAVEAYPEWLADRDDYVGGVAA